MAKKYIHRWAEGKNIDIHTHSRQAFVEQYFEALRAYFKARQSNSDLRPPFKKRRYRPFIWKNTAIRLLPDGTILLSLGRRREPLKVQSKLSADVNIRRAELVYKNDRYYLHLAIEVKKVERNVETNKVMAIDFGVLRPIACYDGRRIIIYNGGKLNSVLRYRNKRLANIQRALSKCKKGSKRWKKLQRAKKRMLTKTANQARDILHKITSNFVGLCLQDNIGTIVIGDITGIRDRVSYSDSANQKIHQWQFGRMLVMLKTKAELFGMKVAQISEAYTTKVCPVCGTQNKSQGRNYKCFVCGFSYHRDGVGAINIFNRYLGIGQVVGVLASPVGVRFNPHLCGYGVKSTPWKAV